MSKQAIEDNINEIIESIKITLNAKKHLPTLILIFSTIDILSWLNRPDTSLDVTSKDFIAWVDHFMTPASNLNCSAIDLYSARCGIVHSFQAESSLTRDGKAKQIWYAWGKGNAGLLMERIQQRGLASIAVAVQVEVLFETMQKGFNRFIKTLDSNPTHARIVYERASNKFFSNVPHEQLSTSGMLAIVNMY